MPPCSPYVAGTIGYVGPHYSAGNRITQVQEKSFLNPVEEQSGGSVTANLLTGLGVDEFFSRTDGVGAMALLPDALGSTVALGDNTGTLQTQYTYEPFGYATQAGQANSNSYKYTGREDDGSGLYYYRARYYHPRLQKFISEDPLGFGAGDINLYEYVFGNPISRVDPTGLFSPFMHFQISFFAALHSGYGYYASFQIGFATASTDWDTQAVSQAHIHHMTPHGIDPVVAKQDWQNYLRSQVSSCSKQGLGNYLHALQDPYAGGHKDMQDYNGLFSLPLQHILDDFYPSGQSIQSAYQASLAGLRAYRSAGGSR